MKQNSEIREMAYNVVKPNWKKSLVATIIYLVAVSIPSCINQIFPYGSSTGYIGGLLYLATWLCIAAPAIFAYANAMLSFYRGDIEDATNNMLGYVKTQENYKRSLSVGALTYLYIFLWSLLLVIPGIIKSYSYAMTFFIAKENPDLTAEQAVLASMKIMDGNKMKLFLLDLSFIGWIILSMLTFGIGFIFVAPYMENAHAAFYEELVAGAKISVADNTEAVAEAK